MLKTSFFRGFILVVFVSLCGCASITQFKTQAGSVSVEPGETQTEVADADASSVASEAESEPDLPDVDLDADTLESLLTQYFASYQGDWTLASSNALKAAISTRDHRVARMATLYALQNNDYGTALQGAQLWHELQPEEESILSIIIVSQVGAGEVADAIESFEEMRGDKLVEDHIKDVAALLVRQRNTDGALGVLRHYVHTNPESAQVLLSSAYVAEQFQKYEQAEQWLDQAILMQPDWDVAAQMKADMLENRGKTKERAEFVEQYAKTHPQSVSMNINYAAVLAREERYQEAFDLMQVVLDKNPNDTAALIYIGALAQQLDKMDLAQGYYRKVLELDPSNDEARWSLGTLAFLDEKYVTAERLFNAITTEESFVRAQIRVANARYYSKGLESALDTLDLLEPITQADYIDVALARHRLLLTDHKYEEAFGSINEVLLYLPTDLDLLYARALVAAELKKIDIAEADFRFIIEREPNNADALNALGYTLADQTQRYEEAKVMIEEALEIRPDASHILDSMGWVLYRLKDYENAIIYLEKAYADYQEVEIGAHLGEVYWEIGDQEKAKKIWLESFEKDQDSPVLNDTLQRYGVTFSADQINSSKK